MKLHLTLKKKTSLKFIHNLQHYNILVSCWEFYIISTRCTNLTGFISEECFSFQDKPQLLPLVSFPDLQVTTHICIISIGCYLNEKEMLHCIGHSFISQKKKKIRDIWSKQRLKPTTQCMHSYFTNEKVGKARCIKTRNRSQSYLLLVTQLDVCVYSSWNCSIWWP